MINAPQSIKDVLASNNFRSANLVTINLGDAYDTGSDLILYYTDWEHDLSINGNLYLSDHGVTELTGISRKASTGSDKVKIEFTVIDSVILEAIKSERYINKPTSIDRVIIEDGAIKDGFLIPVRTGFGLSHNISGDLSERSVTLTIDSILGDLDGDNGWYAVNSSHEQRYPGDLIMRHGATVFTEEQRKKYTTDFNGVINQQVKPPALPKIYGYKNVELVPILMLKHRKSHTSYRHYFTTFIYVVSIGECENVDINNLKKDDEDFEYNVVSDTDPEYGGWSVRVRTPTENLVSCQSDPKLHFWRQRLDAQETARISGMFGKGLTLLFVINRNRDDWLSAPPKLTVPVSGAKLYDPRTGLTTFSRNPALQYADYLRSTEYGAGKRNVTVSDANIIELADHFDQLPGSVGNPGINDVRIDIQLDTAKPIVDNMNIWMEGVRLFTSDYYGQFLIRVETISSPVWSFNEDDLEDYPDYDSGEFTDRLNKLTYTTKQLVPDTTIGAGVGALVEVDVEATFPTDGSQIEADWLAEDGGIVNFESSALDYVTELEQSFYWCAVDARVSRQQRTLTLTVGEIGWLMEVGDVVTFTSEIINDTDVEWRVDEVAEDDESIELSLIAYDGNFYTPDPNAIPDPTAPAQPPTVNDLGAISGLEIIFDKGNYYLNWDALSDSNVSWYAVEIEETSNPGVLVYDEPKVPQPPLLLNNIVTGDYQANIVPFSTTSEGNIISSLIFTIGLPVAPTLTVIVGALDIQIIPRTTAGVTIGQLYELEFGTDNNQANAFNYGTSGSFTVAKLTSGTNYYFWVRAVNPVGESAWVTGSATTSTDGAAYVDLVGEDVAAQVLPDVVSAVEGDLQTIVDGSLAAYSTTVEVNNIVTSAIGEIDAGLSEDPKVAIVEQVTQIFDNAQVDRKYRIETNELNSDLQVLSNDLSDLDITLSVLNNNTLPNMQLELDIAENKIDTLNNVTIPALQDDLVSINGLFPVTATNIADDAITTPKIVTNAVTSDKIVANAVTADKIVANSISTSKIVANAVTSDKIVADAITANKIATNAVSADKIAANSISTSKIVANAVSADKIAANTISADKIQSDAVTSSKIATDAITANKISAGAVEADALAVGAVVASAIASNSIASSKIQADAVTSEKILAGEVKTINLAAGAVVASSISSNAIESDKIEAGAITGVKISADALDGKLITGTLLRTAADTGNNYRVVVGDPSLPFWYGKGAVATGNDAIFYVNSLGTAYAQNLVIEGNSIFRGTLDGADGTFDGNLAVTNLVGDVGDGVIVSITSTNIDSDTAVKIYDFTVTATYKTLKVYIDRIDILPFGALNRPTYQIGSNPSSATNIFKTFVATSANLSYLPAYARTVNVGTSQRFVGWVRGDGAYTPGSHYVRVGGDDQSKLLVTCVQIGNLISVNMNAES